MTYEERIIQVRRMIVKLNQLGFVSKEDSRCIPQADSAIRQKDAKEFSPIRIR